jgi:uncharacterized LabA/DUF88 family protein
LQLTRVDPSSPPRPLTMPTPNDSIALLIDADNAPAKKIDFIISELATHGVVNIRKAYGNWKKKGLAGWERILQDHAIQPIQQFDLVKGKNATDMALLVEAMDILYTKDVQTVVDDKAKYTDWSQRADIKAELKVDLILLLGKHGYPPVDRDEVYKEIFEQAENFKKFQAS